MSSMSFYIAMAVIIFIFVAIYSYSLMKRLMIFYHMDSHQKWMKVLRIVFAAVFSFLCLNLFSMIGIICLHFFVVAMFLDVIALFIKKIIKYPSRDWMQKCHKLYQSGILIFIIAGIIVGYGMINMNFIIETHYDMMTTKQVNDYKIILLTDVHYDTVQNVNVLKNKIDEINQQNADIIVLGGDIVDEGTSLEKMEEVFEMLGTLKSQYGIYYVYGNHDKQPYTSQRTYTDEQLNDTILNNGIHIMNDTYVEINHDLIVAGRSDAAWGNTRERKTSEEILKGIDTNKYIIMIDHQPIETKENNALGVDLELSGHTHAGQIWPSGLFNSLIGTLNYGHYQVENLNVIVSSGIAGWAYSMRTSKHCEYVTIQLIHE